MVHMNCKVVGCEAFNFESRDLASQCLQSQLQERIQDFLKEVGGWAGGGGKRKCVSCCDLLLKVVGHSTPESSEK